MKCPQCAAQLKPVTYERVQLHTCERCGGEFIDGEAFGQVVRTREQSFSQELQTELADHQPTFSGTDSHPDRQLTCPACENTMSLVNYSGGTGIFVDRCQVCTGLWLDHEELDKIQVIMERWADEADGKIQSIAKDLERARVEAAAQTTNTFQGARFSFINAIVNRFLDAA